MSHDENGTKCITGHKNRLRIDHLENDRVQVWKEIKDIKERLLEELKNRPPWIVAIVLSVLMSITTGLIVAMFTKG